MSEKARKTFVEGELTEGKLKKLQRELGDIINPNP
ncbi:hypothetical protein SAMN00768000_2404 [Sulfobacillus thermosulfidooxidans DSM 9293]|uniref:Uncharacterized protein n=1 Tax=Sulfobacillus thermosulfidooxidans (strain DSM 9293 / VKM B-1269 / AT-1) TaxID=929705 RepID=A0A1W1WHC3_SULTA|nr:hypothetical protein SAMN00768000_2404 [Sulfobacillus thermosulfidooxidans DSM 9293]